MKNNQLNINENFFIKDINSMNLNINPNIFIKKKNTYSWRIWFDRNLFLCFFYFTHTKEF